MVIETLKHQYYVIHKEETEIYDILSCRELVEERHKAYDVYCIKEPLLIQRLIPELSEKDKNENFEDFYECFTQNGLLYLVFIHCEGVALEKKLEEDCSLEERMHIGKNILERILLLDMPDYFLCEICNINQILIDKSLAVGFRYQPEGILLQEKMRERKILDGIATMFRVLFQNEILLEKCPEIERYLEDMQEGRKGNMLGIYQGYEELCEVLKKLGERGRIRPNTLLFRIWNRIKQLAPYAKRAIEAAIVLALAGYLIYTIMNPEQSGECLRFDSIGTLEIHSIQE